MWHVKALKKLLGNYVIPADKHNLYDQIESMFSTAYFDDQRPSLETKLFILNAITALYLNSKKSSATSNDIINYLKIAIITAEERAAANTDKLISEIGEPDLNNEDSDLFFDIIQYSEDTEPLGALIILADEKITRDFIKEANESNKQHDFPGYDLQQGINNLQKHIQKINKENLKYIPSLQKAIRSSYRRSRTIEYENFFKKNTEKLRIVTELALKGNQNAMHTMLRFAELSLKKHIDAVDFLNFIFEHDSDDSNDGIRLIAYIQANTKKTDTRIAIELAARHYKNKKVSKQISAQDYVVKNLTSHTRQIDHLNFISNDKSFRFNGDDFKRATFQIVTVLNPESENKIQQLETLCRKQGIKIDKTNLKQYLLRKFENASTIEEIFDLMITVENNKSLLQFERGFNRYSMFSLCHGMTTTWKQAVSAVKKKLRDKLQQTESITDTEFKKALYILATPTGRYFNPSNQGEFKRLSRLCDQENMNLSLSNIRKYRARSHSFSTFQHKLNTHPSPSNSNTTRTP